MFGAYTTESWRIAPRFYGTGETFVFQLEVGLKAEHTVSGSPSVVRIRICHLHSYIQAHDTVPCAH